MRIGQRCGEKRTQCFIHTGISIISMFELDVNTRSSTKIVLVFIYPMAEKYTSAKVPLTVNTAVISVNTIRSSS